MLAINHSVTQGYLGNFGEEYPKLLNVHEVALKQIFRGDHSLEEFFQRIAFISVSKNDQAKQIVMDIIALLEQINSYTRGEDEKVSIESYESKITEIAKLVDELISMDIGRNIHARQGDESLIFPDIKGLSNIAEFYAGQLNKIIGERKTPEQLLAEQTNEHENNIKSYVGILESDNRDIRARKEHLISIAISMGESGVGLVERVRISPNCIDINGIKLKLKDEDEFVGYEPHNFSLDSQVWREIISLFSDDRLCYLFFTDVLEMRKQEYWTREGHMLSVNYKGVKIVKRLFPSKKYKGIGFPYRRLRNPRGEYYNRVIIS